MRDAQNCEAVAHCGPDLMGFIFYEKSPRFVGHDFNMPAMLKSEIKRVGVFVNEKKEVILQQVQRHNLDMIQLHGDETIDLIMELRQSQLNIIKAFRIDEDFDFKITETFANYVDYFLFDTKGKYFGGNATRFDWKILDQYEGNIPFLLSGGIKAEHIEEIKSLTHPRFVGVDLNSGVELSAGCKDVEKVKKIINGLN